LGRDRVAALSEVEASEVEGPASATGATLLESKIDGGIPAVPSFGVRYRF
jgi:hypothetical protein